MTPLPAFRVVCIGNPECYLAKYPITYRTFYDANLTGNAHKANWDHAFRIEEVCDLKAQAHYHHAGVCISEAEDRSISRDGP